MGKLHSGMDAWRNIVHAESRQLTVVAYLPLILSAAGAVGILPFAIMRFVDGEWLAAAIDTVIIASILFLGFYVFRTRKVRVASVAIAVICSGGVLSTVYINGPHQAFWVFPALIAMFYLVRPREAAAFTVITVIALLPALRSSAGLPESSTILVTIFVTSAFAFAFSLITNRQREQLLHLATRDPLTGTGNRRGLDAKLAEVVRSFGRTGRPSSLVMLDLDHFKQVNDVHGHAVGDRILRAVTDIINLRIRVTDSLYRIGGEEFVVVLEDTNLERAGHLAEQLRTLVDANELVPDSAVTISLGVAEIKKDESGNDWLHRADAALYRAKGAGRNSTSLSN